MSTNTPLHPPDTHAVRPRVTLADRIALRIGMSLIIWSRRTRRVHLPVDLETRNRLERERLDRETHWATQGAAMMLWR